MEEDPFATYYPKGELVIVQESVGDENSPAVLAYKFDIYSAEPLSRGNYYINASTGRLVLVDQTLKHVVGPAATRYSGQRNIETQQNGSIFRLWDITRGNGIRTFNMNNSGNFAAATDLTDNDNNWTTAEHSVTNRALLDAHWGAMMTYDYFRLVHNRNSIDGQGFRLLNFVNANEPAIEPNNAGWDGQRMIYGIGTGGRPFVSVDIVGHEIAHGLDQFTSSLFYQDESGAIDESLADIWGAMIELRADPSKQTWTIGEDVVNLRSLSNPKLFNQPDTYQRINWATGSGDHGGVHTNSGVMNHWFYLLSEGSAATDGVNDRGDRFSFTGIGSASAARIVYRAQTVYFTSTTNYASARTLTIRAAQDLFGVNSREALITNNAWYAVGIGAQIIGFLNGDDCACTSPNTTLTLVNNINQTVTWTVSSNLVRVSSNNTAIVVRAGSNSTRAMGRVTATFGGNQVVKDIWVGLPQSPPSTIAGPTTVAYSAVVNYSSPAIPGASSYKWYLPYPYSPSATVQVSPDRWGILSGSSTRYISAQAGPNNGLVQVMGVNKCGTGGARTLNVVIGNPPPGGGGGGGTIPLRPTLGNVSQNISLAPNPTSDMIAITLAVDTSEDMILIAPDGRVVRSGRPSDRQLIFDVRDLPNGMYFVAFKENHGLSSRVIIMH